MTEYGILWGPNATVVERNPDGTVRPLSFEEQQALWDSGVNKGDLMVLVRAD